MINKFRTKKRTNARAHNSSKAKAKHRRSMVFMSSKQQGFTLIELLVVVSILAALAGITSIAMDGYQQDAEEKITRVEMQRIATAIRRFKADTGYWPKTETENGTGNGANDDVVNYGGFDAANFNFLFNKPDEDMQDWTPEYAIGWHGPYINLDAIKTIVEDNINTSPGLGCSGLANNTITGLNPRMNGLIDRFEQIRERVTGTTYCVITRDEQSTTDFKVTKFSGSPYLYETAFNHSDNALCDTDDGNDCIAIRSFGPDGIDNGGADNSDDIVFVLEQNS